MAHAEMIDLRREYCPILIFDTSPEQAPEDCSMIVARQQPVYILGSFLLYLLFMLLVLVNLYPYDLLYAGA